MRIMWNNLVDTATLTASSEEFPVENIQDTRISKKWRSASYLDSIVFDMGTAKTVNCLMISGHNFTVGFTLITLQGNATNSWGSPSISETITARASHTYKFFTGGSYRYWRLLIEKVSGYIEIGRVFLGAYYQAPSVDAGVSIPYYTTSQAQIAQNGQAYGNAGYCYRKFGLGFTGLDSTDKSTLITMFGTVQNIKPVYIALWESSIDTEDIMYALIENDSLDFKLAPVQGPSFSLDMDVREVF